MHVVINAKEFGLKKNSDKLQTKAIQDAIDYCYKNGGGVVEIPEGNYFTGDIRIRSNITLHLLKGANLTGSKNPQDYFNYLNDNIEPLNKNQITDAGYVHLSTILNEKSYEDEKSEYRFKRIVGSRWNNAVIRAVDAQNIKIIGEEGSVIDGANCFDEIGEEEYRGPHGITFFNCTNIELNGYTIKNAGNWAHNLLFCDNITADNITVLAGHDGFDASVCNNLKIVNSKFYTGDDCIAGVGNVNTYVSECVLNSSCSAMRFGGSNVLVEKCDICGPGKYCFRGSMTDEEKRNSKPSKTKGKRNNMLSAFTYYADYSLPIKVQPGNIIISDCTIKMADRFLHYNYSGNETWQKHRPLESIEFRNIKAEGVKMPVTAYGDENIPVKLTLKDIEITLREGYENIDLIHACNYSSIVLDNVSVSGFKGECMVRKWSEGEILFKNVKPDNINKVKKASKPFFTEAI
ncbi:MAG: hypothetical protein E7404_00565 [Ruminococcaceae bacterium]|nr:hypothetical protein [Oscillospiraceae bacterium]